MKMNGIKEWFMEHRQHVAYGFVVGLFLIAIGWYAYTESEFFMWIVLILLCADYMGRIIRSRHRREHARKQIEGISHRVKHAGDHVFNHLPLGILLYDETHEITWFNPGARQIFGQDLLEKSLREMDLGLFLEISSGKEGFTFGYKEQIYRVEHLRQERLMYLSNVTDHEQLKNRYREDQPVMGVLMLDNYDEAVRNLTEQEKNDFRGKIVSIIMAWAGDYKVLIRRTNSDRYVLMMSQKSLETLQQNKFSILDSVRDAAKERDMTFTISIGIASGYDSFPELGGRANNMLDLALSRGGDQVAIKSAQEDKFLFYGGKTNPVEKRNRVRARVNSQAYERLVRDSDLVIVMGHRFPDVDAIGACIGLMRMSLAARKEAYIVLNKTALDNTAKNFVAELLNDERLEAHFISPETALSLITRESLLVVADTQDPKLVIEPALLAKTKKVAVFDHHRRGASYIDSILSYTEPYASSTVELVVDMFDYYSQKIRMSPLEASVMLAGIIVDTRRFSYHTGRRTYETAAILKQKGAEEKLVQQLLRAPIENYYSRAHLMERAEVFREHFLIAPAKESMLLEKVQLAQAADELLNVQHIKATFAIGRIDDQHIGISARSLGEVNVQTLMEQLGGGGHLNTAATQLTGTDIYDIVQQLKKILEKELEESEA